MIADSCIHPGAPHCTGRSHPRELPGTPVSSGEYNAAASPSQLEVRSKLAEKKESGEAKPERKRRRWDQQSAEDETPTKKKSAWDQAEVREEGGRWGRLKNHALGWSAS